MLHRPAFKPQFHVEPVAQEGTFLLSEQGHFVLFGPTNEKVARAIDGRRTTDEIVDELAGEVSMQELYLAFAALERDGYLVEADDLTPRPEAAFWSILGTRPAEVTERSAERTVTVTCLDSEADEAAVAAALERLGVGVAADGQGDATLVVVDDYLRPELAEINARQLESGRPWALVKPRGFHAWVGPLLTPRQTACWRCLEHRLRGNREVESFIERAGKPGPFETSVAATSATTNMAIELAALHLRMLLGTERNPVLEGRLLTVSWAMLDQRVHVVSRRPQCPACGDPGLADVGTNVPLPRPTGAVMVADGGLRAVSAEATYDRYQHLVSPITGVVSHLTEAEGVAGTPLNVVAAGHNFALKNDSLYFLREGLRTNSAGKGRTPIQARTSALCEAVERYSGVYMGDEKRVRARYRDLGALAIHPNACMMFSDRQFREREAWLAAKSHFQVVPLPFEEDAELDWTPVRSLLSGEQRYLPTGYLYYGYPIPEDQFFFWADSNGNAAGNSIEEAMLQGFLELAERDAVCIWWYNRVRRPAVDLASLADPYVDEVLEYYRTIGREVWALDLTNDLGIPSFVAISRRIDNPVEDLTIGFGAHLDARTAVLRAVAEMNQFMPAVHRRDEHGNTIYTYEDQHARRWWREATLANQPYLVPLPGRPLRVDEYPQHSTADAGGDLLACVRAAQSLGLETFALNQTRPDVQLPVAKVLVPGLRHFWARFAPGRLYDVPVKLGWLPAPLEESQLNPIAMFV
jgi:oxazoline/thiazoline synthase